MKTKKVFKLCRPYQFSAIEEYLEKMARKGWLLKTIGNFFWEFEEAEQQEVSYSISYVSDVSALSGNLTTGQQKLNAICEESGWEFICSKEKMQIFRNFDSNAVPIDTDDEIKVESIKKAMNRSYVPSILLLIIVFLLQLQRCYSEYLENPEAFFDNFELVMATAIFGLCLIDGIVQLAGYFSWLRKASKSVKDGLPCPPCGKAFMRIEKIIFSLALLTLIFYGIADLMSGNSVILLGIISGVLIIVAALAFSNIIKSFRMSTLTKWIVFIIATVIIIFFLTILVGIIGSAFI